MRRHPRSSSVALLAAAGALFGGAVGAPVASAALSGPEQVAFLNAQRAKHGIPAGIVEVPAWSAACKKHMDWIAATGIFDHYESGPLKTAEGEWGGTHSVLVSGGDAFSATGVNAFEHAPIHLMQMLSPFITRSGASTGCLVTTGDADPLEAPATNTERVFPAPQTFSYPGNGAAGVPVSEDTFEYPFVPAATVGLNVEGDPTRSRSTGPHLYFFNANAGSPNQSWLSRGTFVSASLTGPAGAVDIRTVDHNTPVPAPSVGTIGGYLAPGGIIIPVKPLTAGTTYTAAVTFDPIGADPVTSSWSFTTAGKAPSEPTRITIWNPNPYPGTPIPTELKTPNQPIVPRVPGVKLSAVSVRFKAPITGKIKVEVVRLGKHKDGSERRTTKLSKIAKATAGKVAKLTFKRKLAKGRYEVSIVRAGTTEVLGRSTVTR